MQAKGLGSPAEARSVVGLTDGNWSHEENAWAAREAFRNRERETFPGLSLLAPPFSIPM